MAEPKLGKNSDGKDMHYSVGAVIKKDGKFLLIDRTSIPLGFAGPAGHVDEDESPEQALLREIEEETGLKIISKKLLFEEERHNNKCNKGIQVHYWYLYECQVEGEIHRNLRETKSIGWYPVEEMKNLNYDPVWEYWFKKMGVI